ncbi:Gfo/Idh/MocA family oxidoreductase [Stieleria sp. JC731]|uniref:Gfo/Idh/MocA family protein n=1 Tax=Pirellulaceae TaxID=2691357 RepID=UPI001E2AEB46|nr:Gfo/Idh/MocA family oxidoreductase [Stieleria sp. JC731]MCC9599116.1 Gfo/Idh/MocA family oxidoreductase [Stieleria sp. JC731]
MKRREFLSTAASVSIGSTLLNQSCGAEDQSLAKRRVAIIGHSGRGNYGHGLDTVWLQIPEAQIVGIADGNPAAVPKELKKLGIDKPIGFTDYHSMLEKLQPEFVSIGPRHVDQHKEMILAAINAGAKGIYIEKPLCRSPAEFDSISSAARSAGTKIAVAHRNRYHPAMPIIKAMIDEGKLGRLLEIRGRGKGDHRGGGEDLWVLGSHEFNLMHYFAGKPVHCSALMMQDGHPVRPSDVQPGNEGLGPLAGDQVYARYMMANGVLARYDSIANDETSMSYSMQLIGSKGMVVIHIDQDPVAHFIPGNPYQVPNEPRRWIPITSAGLGKAETNPQLIKQVHNHVAGVRDLIEAVDSDHQPLCSLDDGGVVIEMICAVFASHRGTGKAVLFPLEERENALAKFEKQSLGR